MIWIIGKVWVYRSEILLAITLLQKLRKSASEIAREYVRQQIRNRLRHSLIVIGFQVLLFIGLVYLNQEHPSLAVRLLSSTVLWGVTLFNLGELALVTIPQILALRRTLRSARGYALKYFLEVSVVTELMHLNVLFLALCLGLGISSRTVIGSSFSYFAPWRELMKTGAAGRPAPNVSKTGHASLYFHGQPGVRSHDPKNAL